MKIYTVFENNKQNTINEDLVKYIISNFENADIYGHKLQKETMIIESEEIEFLNKSDLIVLCIQNISDNFSANFKMFINKIKLTNQTSVFNRRPVFIIQPIKLKETNTEFSNLINQYIQKENSQVIDHFSLNEEDFSSNDSKINRIQKVGELLRKINKMKREHFSSEYKFDGFTCGIDPNRDYCGDAIEY